MLSACQLSPYHLGARKVKEAFRLDPLSGKVWVKRPFDHILFNPWFENGFRCIPGHIMESPLPRFDRTSFQIVY